jgi:hypothetical protein
VPTLAAEGDLCHSEPPLYEQLLALNVELNASFAFTGNEPLPEVACGQQPPRTLIAPEPARNLQNRCENF